MGALILEAPAKEDLRIDSLLEFLTRIKDLLPLCFAIQSLNDFSNKCLLEMQQGTLYLRPGPKLRMS